ncbi:PLP-dependent aminotransferase family protein [Kibdelosporangium philippinense]|uniref:PLP-dependent aminotransferase family protein n=1 Tax=Kibdelosporangium philippinense TaxID=211113 RepID=A0ABS8ZBE0_9PSEU|nr:PLP-dependent aminotransferase family protein [Kibdelosporangium philippinense]MCE7005191.1 PLP-dependent aminotransferase family protein [Kibdelosporangium philippinense]
MTRSQTNLGWDVLLDMSGPGAQHERLARALRTTIREGVLKKGATLPPSRKMAGDLQCSRWVVTQAYAQLVAEGYLEARTGSATRVHCWADEIWEPVPRRQELPPPRYDLAPGLPDLRNFPRRRWADAVRDALTTAPHTDLGMPIPGGHPRLRTVLAEYLRRTRGAVTDDVLITSGVCNGVALVGRALHAAGITQIAVEEPGWTHVWRAAEDAGLEVVRVPVDADGLCVDQIPAGIRAVVVTPAHQFPSGVVLTPERRAALLTWARDVDGLILEDDYDAEFRYDRKPVGTVQGMDPRRVVLLGSIAKTLSPALGIGWCVVPPQWTIPQAAPPVIDQLALATFIENGGYHRYLRAARLRYRKRRDALLAALGPLDISGAAAGLHLLLHLDSPADDVVNRAAASGLKLKSLDAYRSSPGAPALVLGYGNLADSSVTEAVAVLKDSIGRSGSGSSR